MEIKFTAGNPRLALDFIKNLKPEDNLALLTHVDFDGITCAKIMKKIINPKIIKFLSYSQLREPIVKELKDKQINKIILTDLSLDFPEFLMGLEKFSEILIIDHHQFRKDLNSEKTSFTNAQGYTAAFICYSIFSEIQNLESLDWMIALACLSDWMIGKNKTWIEKIYKKYNEPFNPENFQQGRFWDLTLIIADALIYFRGNTIQAYNQIGEKPFEIGDLEKYAEIIKKEIQKNVEMFEKQKQPIKNGWFYEIDSPYDISSRFASQISSEHKNKTYVVAVKEGKAYKVSARQQDKKGNMAVLLQNTTKGFESQDAGGHLAAAGCNVEEKDYEQFKKRLKQTKN